MDSLFSADEEASVLLWTSVSAAAAAAAVGCLTCCYCCCCKTKKRKRLKEGDDGDGDEDKNIVNEDDDEELDFRLAYTSASASASSLDLLSHCNNRSSMIEKITFDVLFRKKGFFFLLQARLPLPPQLRDGEEIQPGHHNIASEIRKRLPFFLESYKVTFN